MSRYMMNSRNFAMGPDNATRIADCIEAANPHAQWCTKQTPCHTAQASAQADPVLNAWLNEWTKYRPIGRQLCFAF